MCGTGTKIQFLRDRDWDRDWDRDRDRDQIKITGTGSNRNPKLYEIVNFVIFGRYLTQIFKKSSKKPSTVRIFFDFETPLNIKKRPGPGPLKKATGTRIGTGITEKVTGTGTTEKSYRDQNRDRDRDWDH
jgi:hypothetical protein